MLARSGAVLCMAGMFAATASAPHIPVARMTAIKCAYGPLQSNPRVLSIAAYSIDGFRHAIEFTFRGKSGHVLTGDMMISGPMDGELGWSIVAFHGESGPEGFEELDFLDKAVPDMDSKCHLSPMGDNLIPGPKPRSKWKRLNLRN